MKDFTRYLLALSVILFIAGCTKVAKFDGPTVDAFHGQLVSDGKPISFAADEEEIRLFLIHQGSGERFRIPIKADGTFDIGWMPIGQFNCMLERKKKGGLETRGVEFPSSSKPVPGGLRIEEGKTEYELDVGAAFEG